MPACELCNHELGDGARFCSFCGASATAPTRKSDFELGKLAAIEEVQDALVQRLRSYALYLGIPFLVLSWLGLDAWLQNKAEQVLNVELRTDLKTLSQEADNALRRLNLITTDLVAARIQYQFALAETFALLHESLITFDETLERARMFSAGVPRTGPISIPEKSAPPSKKDSDLDIRLAALDLVYTYGDFLLGLTTGEGSESTRAFLSRFTTQLSSLNDTQGATWGTGPLAATLPSPANQLVAASIVEPAGKVTTKVLERLEADAEDGSVLYATLSNYSVLLLTSDIATTTRTLITHVRRYGVPEKSFSSSAKSLEGELNRLIAGIVNEAPITFRYSALGGRSRFSAAQGAPEVYIYLNLIERDVTTRRGYVTSVDKYRNMVEAYKTATRTLAGTYKRLAQVPNRNPDKASGRRLTTEDDFVSTATQTKALRDFVRELSTVNFQLRRAQANYRTATQGLLSKG